MPLEYHTAPRDETMDDCERASVEQLITALWQLGGEAQATDIKDRVTANCGGVPARYKSERSYRETLQRILEDHFPASKNWGRSYRQHLFDKTGWGRYRLH